MTQETSASKKYLVWNNKGGVGKTFLTYVLAQEYALQHPDEDVAVIDACPQANVSEMLLGGNGKGEDNLTKLRNKGASAKDALFQLPRVHSFVLNRSRSHLQDAAKAFKSHAQQIEKLGSDFFQLNKTLFLGETPLVFNIKDGNTLASSLNHEGVPLSKLEQRKYIVYEQKIQANNSQIEPLLKDVQTLVACL